MAPTEANKKLTPAGKKQMTAGKKQAPASKQQTPARKKTLERSKAFFARRAQLKTQDLEKKARKAKAKELAAATPAEGITDGSTPTVPKGKGGKTLSIASVPQNELFWTRSTIPQSSADVEGTTDADFWETLYAADEASMTKANKRTSDKKKSAMPGGFEQTVWMGLEEVEGVDVVTQKDPTGERISFIPVAGHKPRTQIEEDTSEMPDAQSGQPLEDVNEPDTALQAQKEGEKMEPGAQPLHADTADTEPAISSDAEDFGAETHQEDEDLTPSGAEEPAGDMEVPGEESLAQVAWHALEAENADDEAPPEVNLDEWKTMPLSPLIQYGLHKSGFRRPTPIQAGTVGKALEPRVHAVPDPAERTKSGGKRKRVQKAEEEVQEEEDTGTWNDIVGVAQTGSGKTMAYSLPILERLLRERHERLSSPLPVTGNGRKPLIGLIICPTRELALQVSDAIRSFVKACTSYKVERTHPFASVVSVVGGLSSQKQSRELHAHGGADIIVATPGRLWDVVEHDNVIAERMRVTRCLVIDEADRVMQDGHFAEMKDLLRLLRRHERSRDGEDRFENVERLSEAEWGGMQTYIFSATLSATLQVNLKRRRRGELRRARGTQTLDALMEQIDFRDPDPTVVDLSPHSAVAETVIECKTECLNKDKDIYLYYFLLRYPGRSLVFLNSIDGLRRLQPLLQHLGVPAFSLHSNMQQRQRLKVLDRFKNAVPDYGAVGSKTAVLLATDVAARGLDLPVVDHVVHYQLPRSADTYVHRSGRTGRAGRTGVALAMVEPKEQPLLRSLLRSLGRKSDDKQNKGAQADEADLRSLPIEYSLIPQLRERVTVAAQIDQAEHKVKKESHDDAWLKQLAQDAELDLSEEEDMNAKKDDKMQSKGKTAALKAELRQLLQTPLRLRGVSTRYITSNGVPGFVDDLLHNNNVENIPGVRRVRLEQELAGAGGAGAGAAKKGSAAKRPKHARTSF